MLENGRAKMKSTEGQKELRKEALTDPVMRGIIERAEAVSVRNYSNYSNTK